MFRIIWHSSKCNDHLYNLGPNYFTLLAGYDNSAGAAGAARRKLRAIQEGQPRTKKIYRELKKNINPHTEHKNSSEIRGDTTIVHHTNCMTPSDYTPTSLRKAKNETKNVMHTICRTQQEQTIIINNYNHINSVSGFHALVFIP